MHIRIFATQETGLAKYFNLLRADHRSIKDWVVENVDSVKWQPETPATIHVYVDHVVRHATPFATYNVLIAPELPAWATTEIDLHVPTSALAERSRVVREVRKVLEKAVRNQHELRLPIPQESGAVPPKVAIITCTQNRARWWPNMIQNVLKQSWPVSRLEWIIVDNGEDDQLIQNEVQEFIEKMPLHIVKYKLAQGLVSIGELRNLAVEQASADVTHFVVMDDDDYYPPDSIKTRMSWMTRPDAQIVYCATIPMYDTVRYISAMNVPPLTDAPANRISEATLGFTRAVWESRRFPDYFMAEGEEFLKGREAESVEISCGGVIVSFIHSANTSSRRIPQEQEPNGCHYGFPDEYFRYIHSMNEGSGAASTVQ
jgi:hypothetical protein